MNTYYDWHLMRSLMFVLALGLFAVYAVLVGVRRARREKRDAALMTERGEPASAGPAVARSGDTGAARPYQARAEQTRVALPTRQAA